MKAIGEVLSASITDLVAECWQERSETGFAPDLPERPRFGSFLRVTSSDHAINVFAVVCDVSTGPSDSTHRPTALRLTRDQLRVEQPHIFALLRTEIHATVIGYSDGSDFFTGLPPHPPEVHDFVYAASDAEVRAITANLEFVRLISRVSRVPPDELVAASIRIACTARGGDYQYLVSAGQSLAQSFPGDYERLTSMLRKIKPV
jgi:hypothetical protein